MSGRGLIDAHISNGLVATRLRLNIAIQAITSEFPSSYLFDFAAWSERQGETAWDPRMEAYARQPISARAIPSFAACIGRTLAPLIRPARKVLVLDLDNTLWGGVLGEDGMVGLQIGHDFPGRVYRQIQLAALSLKDQGILLALVSKNNEIDVFEAFNSLADMPLRLSDFSAVRINWERKSENIANIAVELGLGLESFTFVDDSAFEREEVITALPEIEVLNCSDDPLQILKSIRECTFFDDYRATEADALRARDYDSNKQRENSRHSASNLDIYLHSLELIADIRPLETAGLGRALQMLAKTNQFNVTTRRHDEKNLKDILANNRSIGLTIALRDRFGDQGVIGMAISTPEGHDAANLDTFLMSCRALGRGAEYALWKVLVTRLSNENFKNLYANYIPTGRNIQCKELFEKFGMTFVSEEPSPEIPGEVTKRYKLKLPHYPETPSWLKVNE